MSDVSKTVTDTAMGSMEVTTPVLLIGIMIFDLV